MQPRLPVCLTMIVSLAVTCGGWTLAADKKPAKSIEGWGTAVDPGKDCGIGGKEGKLTIKVPAKNHNLNPTYRYGTNAPRVMQMVKGDFTLQVKVTGDFQPGFRPTVNGRPFNGAGLLIWQDDGNFLRLERNAYWDLSGGLVCYPPLIEDWRNGAYEANTAPVDASFFKGTSTWFKISRQGKEFALAMSQDGVEWTALRTVNMDLAEEIAVGVAAVNSSNKPFIAQFEGLELKTN